MSAALEIENTPQADACPNCGARRIEGVPDCPTCGIVFAKFKPTAKQAPAAAPAAAPASPYRAPEASLARRNDAQLYRDGKMFVLNRGLDMPDACIKCGAPATFRKQMKLRWHKWIWYLLIFVNILVYFLVSLGVSRKAEVEVALCDEHHAAYKKHMAIVTGLFLLSLVMVFHFFIPGLAELPDGVGTLLLFGGLMLLGGSILGSAWVSQIVRAAKIEEKYIWLHKCGPDFLEHFPEAPADL